MAEKRLLYFTSRQVAAFSWKAGRLEATALFGRDDDALGAFSSYVAESREALYYVLADVVEEDFHQETIPYVRGKDRRILLGRKLAQRYRDLTLAMSLSLGFETGPRKEEKILFSSFTNTQQFQPWLNILQSQEARLVGVFSAPLVTPQLGKRLGLTDKRYLLVSRQRAGMRQTFVEDGRIRFSRLGQIEGEDIGDRARRVSGEATRIQQFLVNTRMLPRDSGPLTIAVLIDPAHRAAFESACADTGQIRFVLIDGDQAASKTGLKSAPEGLLSEALFLQALATSHPAEQYAEDRLRRFYYLWRTRVALIASGFAVFAFCSLLAALRLVDIVSVREQAELETGQERALSAQYARLQSQFPKMPTSSENLKLLVANYRTLERQNASLDHMFVELSRALAATPQIEIEKIDWQTGAPRRPAAGTAQPVPPPGNDAGSDRPLEQVEISGRVNVVQASDYRNITLLVNQFVESLRKRPGFEIISTQLPFDLNAEKSLSGDIGAERAAETPRFSVVAARRAGS
jgi:hypothetical protein